MAWALAQRERGKADTAGQAAFAVNEREAREAMALSCGMIAMIDDAIGRVLARLAASRAGGQYGRRSSPPTTATFSAITGCC